MGPYPDDYWKNMGLTIMWSALALAVVIFANAISRSASDAPLASAENVAWAALFATVMAGLPVLVLWLVFSAFFGLVLQGLRLGQRVLGVVTAALSGAFGLFIVDRAVVRFGDAFSGRETETVWRGGIIFAGSFIAIGLIAFFVWKPRQLSKQGNVT